jgi:elongation factor 1-alpha
MDKLREEARIMNKDSFCFAFYLDKQKESRERGITINCATKEFFTNNFHYTIIDAPGHRDFIKNMISGASQADVAVLMVPADGGFTTAVAKGNRKDGEVQGQTRMHARLAFLLGIKQVIVCVNKMDTEIDSKKYSQERFNEVAEEMRNMLAQVGFSKDAIKGFPILPISGWIGDNLIKKSENMPWWKGVDIAKDKTTTVHVETMYEALDKYVTLPKRNAEGLLRIPVSGIYKIKGVGDVITGRVEQGTVNPGDEVIFVPSYTNTKDCRGKVFSVEMHHKSVPQAGPGDNVGLNIKGLSKDTMPKTGDIIILSKDTSLKEVKKFTAQIQVLDHPGELKVGYSPIGFVRTGRSSVKMSEIKWKMGKETNNQKVENPASLKQGEMAECVFEPLQSFVVDSFANCEGLGRIAIMDGNSVVMLGKITKVEHA